MKTFILGIAALLAAGSAMADTTSPNVIHDKPGFFYTHLDVDKVLAQTDLNAKCGVVPARLDYLDHAGQEHVLDYQVNGLGCNADN